MNAIMRQAAHATIALLGAAAVSTDAYALELHLGSESGDKYTQLLTGVGSIAPMQYSREMPSERLILAARPVRPILCARLSGSLGNPNKGVVIDPNGHYKLLQTAEGEPLELADAEATFGTLDARGSDPLPFADARYEAIDGINLMYVSTVAAYCAESFLVDVPPTTLTCNTPQAPDEPRDGIFNEQFEVKGAGTLQMGVRVVSTADDVVSYEYVLQAIGGPVYNVQFREQFPYYTPNDVVPVYQRSLELESTWQCASSMGARCGFAGDNDEGLGYAAIDGGRLEAGECLKISASRDLRTDGIHATTFSGRLYGTAFYSKFASGGSVKHGVPVPTRIVFSAP